MPQAQLFLLAAHHREIKKREIEQKQGCGDPRHRGDRGAKSHRGAAKIERIARVRVRAADREHFLFMQIAGSIGTQTKTQHPDQTAE